MKVEAVTMLRVRLPSGHSELITLNQLERMCQMAYAASPVNPLRRIVAAVAQEFDVPNVQIFGPRRPAYVALPRQVIMYLASELTNMTGSQIAAAVNRKDHSTAIHAVKTIRRKMAADPEFRRRIESIIRKVNTPNEQSATDSGPVSGGATGGEDGTQAAGPTNEVQTGINRAEAVENRAAA